MHLYERQQFEFFLQTAVERYVERLEQRFRGADAAMENLRQEPNGQGVWLEGFCEAVFEDFLLNNIDGACFILRAMAQQKLVPIDSSVDFAQSTEKQISVESHLRDLAKRQFSQLLYNKALESLEQHSGYQAM
ncbi:MAG: hypothetical protein SFV81_25505 [Pirellulaceae bacterium]|nr:hypothetical protein [Pirellulaceae bacterium]